MGRHWCRRKERPPSVPLEVNRVLVGEVTVMSSMILEYTTTEPVPAPVVAQVEAAASTLIQARDWRAEPLSVEQTTKLGGSTRLFLGLYSLPSGGYVVVPEDEEFLLIWADVKFIVDRLSEWSAEFNLSWRLEMDGDEVGEITGGMPSTQLAELLDGIYSMSGLSPNQIPELLKRHAARKG